VNNDKHTPHDSSNWTFIGPGDEFRQYLEQRVTEHEARKYVARTAPPEVISRRVDGVQVVSNRLRNRRTP